MPGWLSSVGSGLFTWMLSNATLIAWIGNSKDHQHQPNKNKREETWTKGGK